MPDRRADVARARFAVARSGRHRIDRIDDPGIADMGVRRRPVRPLRSLTADPVPADRAAHRCVDDRLELLDPPLRTPRHDPAAQAGGIVRHLRAVRGRDAGREGVLHPKGDRMGAARDQQAPSGGGLSMDPPSRRSRLGGDPSRSGQIPRACASAQPSSPQPPSLGTESSRPLATNTSCDVLCAP